MAIHYNGLRIEVEESVYEPAEDTFLLAEALLEEVREDDIVLDVGTGSGILALLAAKKAKFVVGLDINEKAIDLAWRNAQLNGIKNVVFVVSDLFRNLRGKFTLILFNPPYLPGDDVKDEIDLALIGGKTGSEVILKFLSDVEDYLLPGGRILIVYSSLTGLNVREAFEEKGFSTRIVKKERFFFEELYVMRAELSSR
ncbi:HemK2/MTQ2 family protein methyltransferase [Pyrococcus abyssi]|uniref:Predicted rRNA or tRNA methylase n=1 Tax=Pyrococcus abyssi (strain GE5 / Orsay) TaxID=272844 RepID=Q9V1J5_PYRAB|nr:HemK2/MTQ2 family protein methyltransferase [Pyrococcus abyssi]CAB49354.1 Predicted rRNA or tRNA methylase [Pyrococcus abyssi GE5]CCE69813.1 TPA: protoporphyrinogen oxidase [Pyrococcus abyssi GE5]